MNEQERNEIKNLPPKYQPLGAWSYFGYTILFSLPIAGFILLIVFSLSDANINRRSFARSYFCAFILVAIVLVILLAVGGGMLSAIMGSIKNQ